MSKMIAVFYSNPAAVYVLDDREDILAGAHPGGDAAPLDVLRDLGYQPKYAVHASGFSPTLRETGYARLVVVPLSN